MEKGMENGAAAFALGIGEPNASDALEELLALNPGLQRRIDEINADPGLLAAFQLGIELAGRKASWRTLH